jgi:DNA-directed RNA polymerase specialized sigma subunit
MAAMNKTYTVKAIKWSGGWELHIDGEGVTQVKTLDKADQMVRSYLETRYDKDFASVAIEVTPDLGGFEVEIREARKALADAADAQVAAALRSRRVVATLRSKGLSVTDSAAVLGVSRGRISQLTK